MADVWLYQMSPEGYSHEDYRNEFREGDIASLDFRTVRHSLIPRIGDIIVIFYCKSRTPNPGIYGWGTITQCNRETKIIEFRPEPPSDRLRLNPLWNRDVDNIINEIRDSNWRPTIFLIKNDLFLRLRRRITQIN